MIHPALAYDPGVLAATCRRCGVRTLSVFGSVTRTDFRPDSDVDVLVEFDPDRAPGLLQLVEMKEELEGLFGHALDIATPEILRNPYRRSAIRKDLERLYAA